MSAKIVFCMGINMGMKTRLLSIVLVLALIVSLAGCSAPPITIEGEENAKAVYTCSPDNMFGLERIVIFQTETVVVFDMQKCDLKGYGGSLSDVTVENLKVHVSMDNADGIWNISSKIEVRDGKYIVTNHSYEDRRYDPDKDVTLESITVNGKTVFINDGSFYLIYTRNSDGGKMKTYTQKYDPVKGTWGKIEHSVNDVPATELNSTLD